MAIHGICIVEGCGKTGRLTRRMCNAHYLRWARHGSATAGGPPKTPTGLPERFYQEVVRTHVGDACLTWPYGRVSAGYGMMRFRGRNTLVHRRICEETHGPAPTPDHEAAHACGRGHEGCVSRLHIRWATGAENQADRLAHGTACLGTAHPRSKLTEAGVLSIRERAGQASLTQLANEFGVTKQNISSILKGNTWGWLS